MTFTKLFSSITDSSIWSEDSDTKVVWVTMLAMSDQFGRVMAAIPGLAKRANVSLEKTESALLKFQSPDTYSRTPDNEGRRIEKVEGGWRLLNHELYRDLRNDEDRKEQVREAQARRRAKLRVIKTSSNVIKNHQSKPRSAQADADADADSYKEKKGSPKGQSLTDTEWMKAIGEKYPGVNVESEKRKMEAWLMTPRGTGRKLTRGFMVNWLNKCDSQMARSPVARNGITNLANFK